MKVHIAALALLAAGPVWAQAPAGHGQHQPGGTPAPQAQTQPQMPAGMPEQCRAAMQSMPQSCMAMMQQMMPGASTGHGTQGHGSQTAPGQAAQTEAGRAYAAAVDRMHGPMLEAIADPDADVAFVKGMIPHHQSAIDMARTVLQHGKDLEVKKWANDVIREQEREISEMRAWLAKRGKL